MACAGPLLCVVQEAAGWEAWRHDDEHLRPRCYAWRHATSMLTACPLPCHPGTVGMIPLARWRRATRPPSRKGVSQGQAGRRRLGAQPWPCQ